MTNQHEIGVGATEELSLRVSVASLVRLLFNNPENGRVMLALERTATLRKIGRQSEVMVKAKPFGGGVRLLNPQALQEMIGDFNYDSEKSLRELDFRIQARPGSWAEIKRICSNHLKETKKGIFDSSPERELAEEFEDNLKVKITPLQYSVNFRKMIIKHLPEKTESTRAPGSPTVRIYYLFEAWMNDPHIIEMMLTESGRNSDSDLKQMAWEDARSGGKGRANAILVLELEKLQEFYQSMSMDRRGSPVRFGAHQLGGNVHAVLQE